MFRLHCSLSIPVHHYLTSWSVTSLPSFLVSSSPRQAGSLLAKAPLLFQVDPTCPQQSLVLREGPMFAESKAQSATQASQPGGEPVGPTRSSPGLSSHQQAKETPAGHPAPSLPSTTADSDGDNQKGFEPQIWENPSRFSTAP